jgi:hypothetical protein
MSALGETQLSEMVQHACLSAFDRPEVSGRISAIVRDTVKETLAEEKEKLQLHMAAQQQPRESADTASTDKEPCPAALSDGMTDAFRAQLVEDIVARNKEAVNKDMLTVLDQMRKLSSNTEIIHTALMTFPAELLENLRQEESSSTIRFGVIEEAVRKAIQKSGTIVQIPSIENAMDVSHPPAAWVKKYFDQSIAAILAELKANTKAIEYTFPHASMTMEKLTPTSLATVLSDIQHALSKMRINVEGAVDCVIQLQNDFCSDMNGAQEEETRATT